MWQLDAHLQLNHTILALVTADMLSKTTGVQPAVDITAASLVWDAAAPADAAADAQIRTLDIIDDGNEMCCQGALRTLLRNKLDSSLPRLSRTC